MSGKKYYYRGYYDAFNKGTTSHILVCIYVICFGWVCRLMAAKGW
jgi:hypothetical protein